MQHFRRVVTLAAAAAMVTPGLMGAAPAPASYPRGGDVVVTCTYTGGLFHATGEVHLVWNGSDASGKTTVSLEEYRITAGGAPYGDKANIDLGVAQNGGATRWIHSPDSMKQDGQWHSLGIWQDLSASPSIDDLVATVEFTFDESVGYDHSCSVSHRL